MKISVEQGTCEVEYVDILVDKEDIKVLEIGTIDKYPEPGGYASGYYTMIWPQNWEKDMNWNATTVRFEGLEDSFWIQLHDTSRYNIYVILLRYSPRTTLWRK